MICLVKSCDQAVWVGGWGGGDAWLMPVFRVQALEGWTQVNDYLLSHFYGPDTGQGPENS